MFRALCDVIGDGMWSRRRVLTASGGLFAAFAFGTSDSMYNARQHPATAGEARQAGWTVVTDYGAVGDGRSRPLSTRYSDLAAARRDFPGVTSLDDELDGVAIQAAIDSGTSRVYYPPGRYIHRSALVVRDGQRHIGAGPSSTLVNVRRRDTAFDAAQAYSFQIGNIHPAAIVVGDPAQSWAVRRLAPVAAGDRSVIVQEPVAPASVAPGDIIMIRSDNPPTVVGHGVTYEFEMWNRVTEWNARTGALSLELPVPRTIVESSISRAVLAGPRLCVNAGADQFLRQPWSIAQNVEIGHLGLSSAGLSGRNGVWRGWFHDLVLDAEQMVIFNALVLSTVERVSGTWSARMIEVKQASHNSTLRDVTGTYRAAPGVTVRPAISVGEQSFNCVFDDITCTIGSDCAAPVRALELSSPELYFRGTLRHFGTPEGGQVWAVKSNNSPANPTASVELDLVVRTGGGFKAYGIIGNTTPWTSYPVDVTLRLDQRSAGEPPLVGVRVLGGSRIRTVTNIGDSLCAASGPAGELPQGMPICP
jgi:hypothetical protein